MKLCAAQSQTPGVTQGHLSQNLAVQLGDLWWEQQPCTGDQNFKFRKALNSNCIFIFVFFIVPAIWSHHMRRDLRPRHTSYVQYKSTTSPVILHICSFDFVRFFFFTSSNTSSSVNRPGGKKTKHFCFVLIQTPYSIHVQLIRKSVCCAVCLLSVLNSNKSKASAATQFCWKAMRNVLLTQNFNLRHQVIAAPNHFQPPKLKMKIAK